MRDYKAYLILVGLYFLLYLPNVLAITKFNPVVFPLDAIYIAKNLMFTEGMKTVVISPVVQALVYPPGIYLLAYVLGSVKWIFWFLFLWQLSVPIIAYVLYKKVFEQKTALVLAMISTYFFVNVNWFSPDFVIQPLLMAGLILLLSDSKNKYVWIGLLTGIAIVFKHNEGIFWGLTVLGYMLFENIEVDSDKRSGLRLNFAISSVIAFGLLFMQEMTKPYTLVYYLFSFFIFWGGVVWWYISGRKIGLKSEFYCNTLKYIFISVLLPISMFLWMGGIVGYSRYFESFTIGMNYLSVYEYDFWQMINLYWNVGGDGVKGIFDSYRSVVIIGMFALPWVVNIVTCVHKKAIGVIGIMGVFMLFPLEGLHILSTKIFLFVFMAGVLLNGRFEKAVRYTAILLVIPILLYATWQPIMLSKMEFVDSNSVIGLKMEKGLNDELNKQIDVIDRNVGNGSYYVIDYAGAHMTNILAIRDNKVKQYYMETRDGFMRDADTEVLIDELRKVDYVVLRDGYSRYEEGGKNISRAVEYVNDNFIKVDGYEGESKDGVFGFSVMKNMIKN